MLIPVFISFIVSLGVSLALYPLVHRLGFLDKPDETRKIHKKPIAYGGGIAILIAFCITALIFFDTDTKLLGLLSAALLITLTGIYDDYYGMRATAKLGLQWLSALILVISETSIAYLTNPISPDDVFVLTSTPLLSETITIIWILLCINAINFIDSLDGLASGIGIICSVFIGMLSLSALVSQPHIALMAFILGAAIFGFLPLNFHPAKMFLGDTGAMLIWLLLGALAIYSGGKIATAALVLAIPLLDIAFAIIRRTINGIHPFKADRKHIHHRLLDHGYKQTTIVFSFWALALGAGTAALMLQTWGKILVLLLLTLILFSGLWFATQKVPSKKK